jgi:hypothetical protein
MTVPRCNTVAEQAGGHALPQRLLVRLPQLGRFRLGGRRRPLLETADSPGGKER